MRVILSVVAIGIIFLGLWLIASSFTEAPPPATPGPSTLTAPPGHTASPVVLGTALLAGGVMFLVMVLRRR